MATLAISKIMEGIVSVSFHDYALFYLEGDILNRKIKDEERDELVDGAIKAGFEEADKVLLKHGTFDAFVESLNLNLELREQLKDAGKRILFGYFKPKNNVYINLEPLRNARLTAKSLPEELRHEYQFEKMKNLIIAHELFHQIEEENKKTIFTRNRKIVLWKIFGYKYKSTVPTLSEIAAMAFAMRVTNFKYCPFTLDPFLQYAFAPKMASLHYEALVEFLEKRYPHVVTTADVTPEAEKPEIVSSASAFSPEIVENLSLTNEKVEESDVDSETKS